MFYSYNVRNSISFGASLQTTLRSSIFVLKTHLHAKFCIFGPYFLGEDPRNFGPGL